MNNQKSLTFGMALLFLIVFVFFGVIIVKEKMEIIFIPRAEKIFDNYLKENYNSIYQKLKKSSISYENNTFKIKLTSKENKNLYFYLTYSHKKVKDTYKKDYVEGNSLLKHVSTSIKKTIKNKTNDDVSITIPNKLNTYTKRVQEQMLSDNNLDSLSIYNLSTELITPKWTSESITQTILTFTNKLAAEDITPKSYTLTISDKTDITKSLKIENLTKDSLDSKVLPQVITNILNKNDSSLLQDYKITYKFLN